MRLLHFDAAGQLSLTDDLRTNLPPYAILSHRWGTDDDEVSYLDFTSGTRRDKIGWGKLRFCGDQARRDHVQYFWIDTCCINKDDTHELSRAITSMFKWYANAQQCYVYLADVSARVPNLKGKLADHGRSSWETAFRRSQWFTRGWTLQELLAPPELSFFSHEGHHLGTRRDLCDIVNAITGIDPQALLGKHLHEFSEAERFRWTINRSTKEPEDCAYCLLGIFGVSMLPQYGEGEDSAFDRLKEEIVRRHRNEIIRLDVKRSGTANLNLGDDFASTRDPLRLSSYNVIQEDETSSVAPTIRQSHYTQSFMTTGSRQSFAASIGSRDLQGVATLGIRRRAITNFLQFDNMNARRANIKLPLEQTCHWLLEHEAFKAWMEPKQLQDSFLWIKGHPGAGKSTLMKFLEYPLAQKSPEPSKRVISFYFNARGGLLERSVDGAYRSLIIQVLELVPDLDTSLDYLRLGQNGTPDLRIFENAPVALLQELFASLVSRLGNRRVYCLVDALDETDEENVLEMVEFLQSLREGTRILVCFSSRHYPTLDIPESLQIIIDHNSGHEEDIRRYIDKHLHIGSGMLANEIKLDLRKKANGIFMWVSLAIGMVNKEKRRGNVEAAQECLRNLPPQLNELFVAIMEQGDVEPSDFLLCLQWLLYAARPLRLEEFYFAMSSGLKKQPATLEWNKDRVSYEDMENRLVTYSKGLAELTTTAPPVVQVIHESVRDFLVQHGGLASIGKPSTIPISSQAHDRLKFCCYRAFVVGSKRWVGMSQPTELVTSVSGLILRIEEDNMPFTRYAVEYLLYHAEEAAAYLSQAQILFLLHKNLTFEAWHFMARQTPSFDGLWSGSLFKALVEQGYLELMQTMLESPLFEREKILYPIHTKLDLTDYAQPLTIAIVKGKRDVVELLIWHRIQATLDTSDMKRVINRFLPSQPELQDLETILKSKNSSTHKYGDRVSLLTSESARIRRNTVKGQWKLNRWDGVVDAKWRSRIPHRPSSNQVPTTISHQNELKKPGRVRQAFSTAFLRRGNRKSDIT